MPEKNKELTKKDWEHALTDLVDIGMTIMPCKEMLGIIEGVKLTAFFAYLADFKRIQKEKEQIEKIGPMVG